MIPFSKDEEKKIPEYLIDFIQNDPSFIPEISSSNLEDAIVNIHENRETADFKGNKNHDEEERESDAS